MSHRALSQHYIQTCQHKTSNKHSHKTSNSNTASIAFDTQIHPNDDINSISKRQKMSPNQLFHKNNLESNYNHILNQNCNEIGKKHCSSSNILPSNNSILQQQVAFKNKSFQLVKDKHSLAEIDMLKILSDLNCPNSAYDRIINWAKFWNSREIYFMNSSFYTFYKRDVVIRRLSKRYDMDEMKPKTTTVNISTDSNILRKISVTKFDFQQQVLSLLRDKDLMSPQNLVLDSEPGMIPNFQKDKISEINHSDWYECAYNHFIEQYGPNPNRVICGIILAIDKTHTDSKGKLCLESVNFTLSIFNTETRRNNPRAWRSLGFINDLTAKYGGGISETNVAGGIDFDVSFYLFFIKKNLVLTPFFFLLFV